MEQIIMEFFEWIIINGQKDIAHRYNTFVFYASDLMVKGHELPNKTTKKNLVARYFEITSRIDIESFEDKFFTLDEIKIIRNKYSAAHIF